MTRGLGGVGLMFNGGRANPVPETAVLTPSQTLAFGDGFVAFTDRVQEGMLRIARELCADPFPSNVDTSQRRHRGSANNVFCDGHVDAVKITAQYLSVREEDLKMWNRDNQGHLEDVRR